MLALAFSGAFGFFLLISYRYPTDREVQLHYHEAGMDEVLIDSTQADIGYYGVTRRRDNETEEFFVETFPQWVRPWQTYDWDVWSLQE